MRTITLNKTQKTKIIKAMIEKIKDQRHWTHTYVWGGPYVRHRLRDEKELLDSTVAEVLDVPCVDTNDVAEGDLREIIEGYTPMIVVATGAIWHITVE